MNDKERIEQWANALSPEQSHQAIVDLVLELFERDEIHFPEESQGPYWESCGEPIVKGQETFPNE